MDLMTLAFAFAVVAAAGLAGLVVVLRARFNLLAAHIDADRNRNPHARPARRKAARQGRPAKAGLARTHRESAGGALAL